MTEITTSEIKILVIQIIFMALIGGFMFFYSNTPISETSIPGTAANKSAVSAEDQGWISNLIALPAGMGNLGILVSLVVGVFLLFDAMIAIRFAKDIATQWV